MVENIVKPQPPLKPQLQPHPFKPDHLIFKKSRIWMVGFQISTVVPSSLKFICMDQIQRCFNQSIFRDNQISNPSRVPLTTFQIPNLLSRTHLPRNQLQRFQHPNQLIQNRLIPNWLMPRLRISWWKFKLRRILSQHRRLSIQLQKKKSKPKRDSVQVSMILWNVTPLVRKGSNIFSLQHFIVLA